MSNVITSFTRKLKSTRDGSTAAARHRRDGWFDDADNWHDAENESAMLIDGTSAS
jgi:hypothetical protein